jgi:hypothetical protein
MRRVLACVLGCLVGFQPAAVLAQQGSAPGTAAAQTPPPADQGARAQAVPSVEALGMSFARIKRELRILPPSTSRTPLKLEYYVEVQGIAPPIPIFRPGELTTGPVPYGAPTHSDMMDHVTPLAFKSGAVPVSSLAILGIVKLLEWEAQRAREERLEKQRQEAIETERERQRRLKESILLSPPKK